MRPAEARAGDAAAILVDADNLSVAAIDHAFTQLAHQGLRVTLRRAYGGHEKLAGMRDCLLRHGMRSLVNNGKGTTDALLVVDAMDLLHAGLLPRVVAIASSDADFAPLAVRLREAGMWVVCFAQAAKSADGDLARCYDQLVYVDVPAPGAEPEEEPPRPRETRESRETRETRETGRARREKPAPVQPARKAPARKRTRAAAPPPEPADPVRQALDAIDGFTQGRFVELKDVVKRLRDGQLLGRNASGVNFLKKNAPYAELSPPQQPNRLRLKEHGA